MNLPHTVTDYRTPALRELLSLAWPVVISRSSQVVVGIADAVMVASLGESALAAVTTGSINTFTFFILPMGTVFIVSSFSSQFYGQNDHAGARRFGWYGLGIAGFTQLFGMLSSFFIPSILSLFPYSPDVASMMASYMVIRLWSGGAAIGLEALANYYGGLGNTVLPMTANVGAMILNVFANWVFIYGNLGFPALGVNGAAIGSLASTSVAFLFLFTCFELGIGAKRPVKKHPDHQLSYNEFYRMVRFGFPSGLNWFFELLAFTFFINAVVGSLGTTALAAMMAVLQINHTAFMPAFGLMSAGAILAGQSIGAGHKKDVYLVTRMTLGSVLTWLSFVTAVYLLFPSQLLWAFAEENPPSHEFAETGRMLLIMAAAWQLFDGTAGVYAEILRSAGDTKYPMIARMMVSWFLFLPATIISVYVFHTGAFAATFWVVVYIALLAGVLVRRFYKGVWEKMDLTGHSGPVAH